MIIIIIACISQNLSALHVIMNKHLKFKHLATFRQRWLCLAGYQSLKCWFNLLVQNECIAIKYCTAEFSTLSTKKQPMVSTTTKLKMEVGEIQGQAMKMNCIPYRDRQWRDSEAGNELYSL